MSEQFFIHKGTEPIYMHSQRFFPGSVVLSSKPLLPPWVRHDPAQHGPVKIFKDLDALAKDLFFGKCPAPNREG